MHSIVLLLCFGLAFSLGISSFFLGAYYLYSISPTLMSFPVGLACLFFCFSIGTRQEKLIDFSANSMGILFALSLWTGLVFFSLKAFALNETLLHLWVWLYPSGVGFLCAVLFESIKRLLPLPIKTTNNAIFFGCFGVLTVCITLYAVLWNGTAFYWVGFLVSYCLLAIAFICCFLLRIRHGLLTALGLLALSTSLGALHWQTSRANNQMAAREQQGNEKTTLHKTDSNFVLSTNGRLSAVIAQDNPHPFCLVNIPAAGAANLGEPIRTAFVVGGETGLLTRNLLLLSQIESIHHVVTQPTLLELSQKHPALQLIHLNSLSQPSVYIHDSKRSLRRTIPKDIRPELIVIDLPVELSPQTARYLSIEFLAELGQMLSPNGFLSVKVPYRNNQNQSENTIFETTKRNIQALGLTAHVLRPHQNVNEAYLLSTKNNQFSIDELASQIGLGESPQKPCYLTDSKTEQAAKLHRLLDPALTMREYPSRTNPTSMRLVASLPD